MEPLSGLLLVDKPRGPTSHDAVLAVRRLLPRGAKVGHSGTLDPMATGLLVLLIGRATRLASQFQRLPKVYTGRVRLGVETDSGDLEGKTLREGPVPPLESAQVQAAMDRYTGRLELEPPAFSAVKYKGKPLYAWARKGVSVPLQPRPCEVFAFRLTAWEPPEAAFRLECSHGTYARALAVLVGRSLGLPAVLSALRRERVGPYSVDAASALEALGGLGAEGLAKRLLPPVAPAPAGTAPAAPSALTP